MEAIPTILTLLLIVTVLAGAVLAQQNASILHQPIPLSVPGLEGVPLSYLRVFAALGGLLVLFWIAGMIDLAMLRGQVRNRDALLRAKEQEILRIKSEAFDHQQPTLTDIRARLEKVALEVTAMMARLDAGATLQSARVAQEETRTAALERSAHERVGVAQ